MTIILAMVFGATVGFSVAIGFNYNSYRRGHRNGFLEGRDLGIEIGYKEGYNDAGIRYANVVSFPKNEVSK